MTTDYKNFSNLLVILLRVKRKQSLTLFDLLFVLRCLK